MPILTPKKNCARSNPRRIFVAFFPDRKGETHGFFEVKRAAINQTVEGHLGAVGIAESAWTWNRAELVIAIGGRLARIMFKAGMAKRDVHFQLGRISGMIEMAASMPVVRPVVPALELAA